MKNQTKITTNSVSEINSLLEVGQYIRNGNGNLFQISALTENKVQLTIMNESQRKNLVMDRSSFVKLFYNKNYDQIMNPEKFLTEMVESIRTGANRYMVK